MIDPRTPTPRSPARSPALLQRRLRDLHLYLGTLFAPSLLFFAITGALQLFSLHETRPGRAFEPPALLQELGMVHKDQVFELPHRRAAAPTAAAPMTDTPVVAPPPPPAGAAPRTRWTVLALKIFFLLAALGLLTSTCLGIWIALRPGRNRALALALLFAGTAIPVLLLAL